MAGRIPGVDIAHWQGDVDFHKMAAQGVKLVFCKVSQGRTPDPKWLEYAPAAKAAGLFVGGYLFMDVTSSATVEQQAELFLARLRQGAPNMIHMYDCEWDGGSALFDAARIAYYQAVMARVDAALGHKGIIYTIRSFWRDYCSDTAAFLDHDLIVAAPLNGIPPANAAGWDAWAGDRGPTSKYWPIGPWRNWEGWQFAVPTGPGPIYGVQTQAIDMDLYQPDAIARWTGQPITPDTGDDSMSAEDVAAVNKHTDDQFAALKTYYASPTFNALVMSAVTTVLRSAEFPAAIARSGIDESVWANSVATALIADVGEIPTTPGGGGGTGASLADIETTMKNLLNQQVTTTVVP